MNPILSFIAEFISRFFSGKPKFFTIIQVIAAIFAAANVTVSQLVSGGVVAADNKIVSMLTSGLTLAISLTAAILAQLPKKDAPAA